MGWTRVMAAVRWVCDGAVRALAVFALANVLLGLLSRRWHATEVWVQADVLPPWVVQPLVVAFALGVLLARRSHPVQALAVRLAAGALALACLADALAYYRLLAEGHITTSLPLPWSLLLAALLLAWALLARPERFDSAARTRRALWIRVLDQGVPLWLLGVGVLGHLLTFGATDYARPADAAVVLGAAVRPSGEPSQALRDRTLTACDLYRRGLVRTLVLSGGRDPAAPESEPACMARIALAEGVAAADLVLDEEGVDTAATLRCVRRLVLDRGWERVLVVSHDYHLARIHLAAQRARVRACTVPARESRPLLAKPLFVAREVLAWAWYYVRDAWA